MLICLTTVSSTNQGEMLARKIVAAKLAACVQVLPRMTSVYFWDDEVRTEGEYLLLIKTIREKYKELETFIGEHHTYDVPEIVAVESADVSEKYRGWLEAYVKA